MLMFLFCALGFFAIALVAGLFGFGDVAAVSGGIAQLLLLIFVVVLVLALLAGLFKLNRRGAP